MKTSYKTYGHLTYSTLLRIPSLTWEQYQIRAQSPQKIHERLHDALYVNKEKSPSNIEWRIWIRLIKNIRCLIKELKFSFNFDKGIVEIFQQTSFYICVMQWHREKFPLYVIILSVTSYLLFSIHSEIKFFFFLFTLYIMWWDQESYTIYNSTFASDTTHSVNHTFQNFKQWLSISWKWMASISSSYHGVIIFSHKS